MAHDFLGIMNETQLDTLVSWLKERESSHKDIAMFWRMRGRQMRKTSGLLEKFYEKQGFKSGFVKEIKPLSDGYFIPSFGDDVEPANRMTEIKTPVKSQLRVGDEAEFWMNHVRAVIERCDDLAQEGVEAPEKIKSALSALRTLFGDSRFNKSVLIRKADEGSYRTDIFAEPGTLEHNFAKNPNMEVTE